MDLCRLERMKLKVSTYAWAVGGIFASQIALGILFLFLFLVEHEEQDAELFANWNGLFALVTAIGFACYSVFSGTLAAKLIVGEYCGEQVAVLFGYPVGRKEVLRAKCLVSSGITAGVACISNLLSIGGMYVFSHVFRVVPEGAGEDFIFQVVAASIFLGVSCAAVGMVSALAGWKKGSGVAAVVCAVVVVCCTTNVIAIAPGQIAGVMAAFGCILAVAAGVSCHMLSCGIEQMEV